MKRPAAPTLLELKERLRAAGLRGTSPRIAVLQRLEQLTAPVSHAELHEQLGSTGLDRATVYRNLVDLAEAGLVRRRDLGDHVWRFELARGEAHGGPQHPHFTCVECGDVSCLPDVEVKLVSARGAPRSLQRRAVEVQLRGTCDDCGV